MTVGNALAGVGGLLAAAGVVKTNVRDDIEAFVEDYLKQLGLAANVRQLRHGRLVLEAGPQMAGFLRYETERLRQQLGKRFPGKISLVVVWAVHR